MFTKKRSTLQPSYPNLPITRGNIIGRFYLGGDITSFGLSRCVRKAGLC